MLINYLQVAFRNLWKNKSFTAINVTGLAVGMAISLLSLLYVTNELSFDSFQEHKDRICRVIVNVESAAEGTETSSIMTAGVGPSFQQEIPEVEHMVRVSNPSEPFFSIEGVNYRTRSVIYADTGFFDVFTFPLLHGNPDGILKRPYSLVLSRSLATKMFGDAESAMGKIVRMNDRDNYMVNGVAEDPPLNSHLRFDAVCSFVTLYENPDLHLGWNGGWNYFTYLLLVEGSSPARVQQHMATIADKNINQVLSKVGISWNFRLQPLSKVHLDTSVSWDIETQGSHSRLVLFIAVTFIILVIACINFINLTTASSLSRMKEVGIRKVSGAGRKEIVFQFLTESLLISFIALLFALMLIELFSIWLSHRLADTILLENFELYNRPFYQLAFSVLFVILIVGLVAGAYPAFLMSRFKPALAVKGRVNLGSRNPLVRNLLVVFQFTISVALIIAALVIASQLDFLLRTGKGFDPANKLVIPLSSKAAREKVEVLKESFLQVPGIEKAGASSQIPGRGYTQNGYFPEGHDQPLMFHALDVDYDYLEVMGIELAKGRNFSREFGQDEDAYIINQALAGQVGWEEPVGRTVRRGGDHKVIGMVKDYNYSTMHDAIGPLVITLKPWQGYSYITLLSSAGPRDISQPLERQWKAIVPNEDFEMFSLESYVREAYGPEREYMSMLLFCAGLTLFIASLGLFGLAAFLTRRRYREIAVRKVFGAGIRGIVLMVSTGFLRWVLLANLIGWPLAYFLMGNYFLANFAYSGGIPWWTYVVALLFSTLIAFAVILVQVLRLGRLNPVDYIRYE